MIVRWKSEVPYRKNQLYRRVGKSTAVLVDVVEIVGNQ